MKITALVLKNNRIQVFVGGEYSFSATQNFIIKNLLYVDKVITDKELQSLKSNAEKSIIEYKLAEYAAKNRYSKAELARKVKQYSQKRFNFIPEDASINEGIKKLEEAYLYNEESLISNWIQTLLARSKSKQYIAQKLNQKGFDRELITKFLKEDVFETVIDENLKKLLQKKLNTLTPKKLDKNQLRQKLIQFALNKRYPYASIKRHLDNLL